VHVRNYFFIILIFMVALLVFSRARANDNAWPQFRGPNGSGVAVGNAKPPLTLNDETMRWKTSLPVGHSSPCVWGDRLFVTGYIELKGELQTICINTTSGEMEWRRSIFPKKVEGYHDVSNAAQTSPATDGERVYVYFGSYGLLCYSVTGELVWDYKIDVHPYRWGVATSPVICGNKLVLSRDIRGEWYLLAVDKFTGQKEWKTDLPDLKTPWATNWASPVMYKDQIVLHRTGEIAAYNVKDGRRTWWLPYLTSGVSTPIVHDDVLFVAAWQNYSEAEQRGDFQNYLEFSKMLAAFDKDKNNKIDQAEIPDSLLLWERPEITDIPSSSGTIKQFFGYMDNNQDGFIEKKEWDKVVEEEKAFYTDAGLIALKPDKDGALLSTDIKWKENNKIPEVPSPIYVAGNVYMCKNGGILTCVKAETGRVLYQDRIGATGPYFASPVTANGYIYIPAGKGTITVIKAGDTLNIAAQQDLGEKIFATPAIVGNTIYVRTTKHLFAFGK